MKYLILLILSINTALACQLSIPEGYIPTFLNPPVSGHYQKCDEAKEVCKCVDDVDPWISEYVTVFEQNELGVNIEKKVFRVSEAKKAAYEASKIAKEEAESVKEAKKQEAIKFIEDNIEEIKDLLKKQGGAILQ
jgi:hypothetical protein